MLFYKFIIFFSLDNVLSATEISGPIHMVRIEPPLHRSKMASVVCSKHLSSIIHSAKKHHTVGRVSANVRKRLRKRSACKCKKPQFVATATATAISWKEYHWCLVLDPSGIQVPHLAEWNKMAHTGQILFTDLIVNPPLQSRNGKCRPHLPEFELKPHSNTFCPQTGWSLGLNKTIAKKYLIKNA